MTSVTCRESRELLGPYIDHETSEDERRLLEAHLAKCARCREEADELHQLRERIRSAGSHPLPSLLRDAIHAAVDAETTRKPAAAPRWSSRSLTVLAASHMALAGLAAAIALQMGWDLRGRDEILHEAVGAQARAMLTDQVVQVASTDRHTVKPWLAAKLPFSPVVRDFKEYGYPLLGARLEILGTRPVAALVYGRRDHRITVYVAPVGQLTGLASMSSSQQGYHAIGWKEGAFDHLAVSDLNRDELRSFVAMAKAATGE